MKKKESHKKTKPIPNNNYRIGERYKATKEEIKTRLNEIETYVRNGIVSQAPKKFAEKFQISERMVKKYIRKVNIRLKKEREANIQFERSQALVELDNLQMIALKRDDFEFILSVRKEKNKILGLYAPTKIEFSVDEEIKELERLRRLHLGQ